MKKTNVTIKLLHQVWDLTKSYWKSEEKKKAYGLLFSHRRPSIWALSLFLSY